MKGYMNTQLKRTSKKYLIVPAVAVGLIAVLAFSSVDKVSAHMGGSGNQNLATVIAQKFGLQEEQVAQALQEYHSEQMETRHQEMKDRLEQRLAAEVQEGSLTEGQVQAILEKHEEMHERMEELREQDLSPEDMREMHADVREEMQTWADENGIDFDVFMRVGGRGHGRMMR